MGRRRSDSGSDPLAIALAVSQIICLWVTTLAGVGALVAAIKLYTIFN